VTFYTFFALLVTLFSNFATERNATISCSFDKSVWHTVQKSMSTEELTAEMANLEGLMKDLNAITQHEFQC